MRTAEEYYEEAFELNEGILKRDAAILAIKTAMTEAIKEAAEIANGYSDYANKGILNLLNNIQ